MTTDTPKSRGAGCMSMIAFGLAGLLGLVLLGAGSCDTRKAGGPPAPPAAPDPNAVPTPAAAPKDWPVGGKEFWGMAITVWVDPQSVPYYVTADVTDLSTGENINLISTDTELGMKVDHQYWTVPIAYPAHHDIRVIVHVKASKPSPRGFITIREGERPYSRSVDFNGTAAAAIDYNNQRS